MDRTDADDFTSSARDPLADSLALKLAHRLPSTQELTTKIDVEYLIPLFDGHGVNRRVFLYTGIVDHNVDRAEFLFHGCKHGQNLIFLADVGLKTEGPAAAMLNFGNYIVALILVSGAIDQDIRAGM